MEFSKNFMALSYLYSECFASGKYSLLAGKKKVERK